jgi:osmotically-inducible protein OsmY
VHISLGQLKRKFFRRVMGAKKRRLTALAYLAYYLTDVVILFQYLHQSYSGRVMNLFRVLPVALIVVLTLLTGCASLSGKLFAPDAHAARYDDAGIKTSIVSTLLRNDASKANDINVHCVNGHVFLVGEADKEFRAAALDIAQQADGVVQVTTHWFPTGTASSLHDTAIEDEIHSALYLARAKAPNKVDLDVWGGHVVLNGLADNQADIDRLLAGIKKISQVKSVTSYIALARPS